MKLTRGLERRLEQLVDGLATKLFGSRIHPLELAARLIREAELALTTDTSGSVAPNRFDVVLGGETTARADPGPAEEALAEAIEETALERGWRLRGPIAVTIRVAEGASGVVVNTGIEPGPLPAWGFLDTAHGDPVPVRPNRAVIGRSPSSDVHVPNEGVSRIHALLWREDGRMWVADLDSSNGTRLNGLLIEQPTELFTGDSLAFGDASFRFRVA